MKIPSKLKPGDTIAVIAPARSLSIISKDNIQKAIEAFEWLGLNVKIMPNAYQSGPRQSASIAHRLSDLHASFEDESIAAIFTCIGGFSSNELLPFIDYELIRRHPKIFCGFSDITALANAITSYCDIVTYSGPHFSTMALGGCCGDYIREHFKKCLMASGLFDLLPCNKFREDAWYLSSSPELLKDNSLQWVLRSSVEVTNGRIWGGNLAVLSLLQGTKWFPKLTSDTIFFLEWCAEYGEGLNAAFFTQRLHSLLQCVDRNHVKGFVIGRFESAANIARQELEEIFDGLYVAFGLNGPVVANVDFGHTDPLATFPIGGTASISPQGTISILEH